MAGPWVAAIPFCYADLTWVRRRPPFHPLAVRLQIKSREPFSGLSPATRDTSY